MYNNNIKVSDIAKKFNIGKPGVYKNLREPITRTNKRPHKNDAQLEQKVIYV